MSQEEYSASGGPMGQEEYDQFATLEDIQAPEFDVLVSSSVGGLRKRIMWAGGNDGFGRVEVYDLKDEEAFIVPVDSVADAQQVFTYPSRHKYRGVPTDMLETYENFDGMTS